MTPHNRFGLALGGGGARGYAHVGVLRVLERERIQPDVIAGTSMGGLIGAFCAAGFGTDDMEAVISSIGIQRMIEFNPLKDWLNRDAFRKLLEQHLPARFEDLPRPFCVTATDLISGKQVYLRSGDLRHALEATIAFPGAVDPVWSGGQLLSDGGILNQVPVDAARFLGASHILAVDVTPLTAPEVSPEPRPSRWWEHLLGQDRSMNWMQVMLRSLEIMQNQITETKLALYTPDVLLRPDLEGIQPYSFNRVKETIAAGQAVAEGDLAKLREVFSR